MMGLLWLLLSLATAAEVAGLGQCLQRYDIPCAEAEVERLGLGASTDPIALSVVADVHFYAGRYVQAYDSIKAAVDAGFEDPHGDLAQYERTMFATAGWVEERRGRFVVRWRPGLDDLLVDDAFDALERAERHLAPLIGGPPPGTTILELYPDARSFIAASSLTADDVYTTGTVALSKWSRLLVTSPRSRGQGYGWQDTIAHEYIHLVVAYRGNGERSVPVWLQEAIAKNLDSRWRDGTNRFALSSRQKGAMADALRSDSLVSFDEMHPSLAKLPSAERAALAYAQLASLMDYCFHASDQDVVVRTMGFTKQGIAPKEALARAVGEPNFEALETHWLDWLRGQDLDGKPLAELPMVLDGGEDLDTDPTLALDRRRADMVQLGDLLVSYDEHAAALVEYDKALATDGRPSPLLSNRQARAHLALDGLDEARALLEGSLVDYPEYPLTHKTLGDVLEAAGDVSGARGALAEATLYNPFDPDVREGQLRLARAAGDAKAVALHERALEVQRRGGDDVARTPIHERSGTYELPRYDQHTRKSRQRNAFHDEWVGERAPSYLSIDVKGREIRPEQFEGKVVVLDFWATWCGPCRKAMPELIAMYERRKSDGLVVVGLTDEDKGKVQAFLAKLPVPYHIGVRASDVKDRYRVSSLPTVFVIDRAGRVREVVVGAGEQAQQKIEEAVDAALAD
jgi:thiol-disulfide isomerase/thioredoxin